VYSDLLGRKLSTLFVYFLGLSPVFTVLFNKERYNSCEVQLAVTQKSTACWNVTSVCFYQSARRRMSKDLHSSYVLEQFAKSV